MERLGELDGVLLGAGADRAGDEDEHASLGSRRLAVDGDDLVLAMLEGERAELAGDGGRALELLALEGEHGGVLVQPHQRGAVGVERPVVVLHEGLGHRVRVHRHASPPPPPPPRRSRRPARPPIRRSDRRISSPAPAAGSPGGSPIGPSPCPCPSAGFLAREQAGGGHGGPRFDLQG